MSTRRHDRDLIDRGRLSERCARALVESAPIGIFETDVDGRCTFVNDTYRRITGVDHAASVLGVRWTALAHPDDSAALDDAWSQAVGQGSTLEASFRYAAPDERIVWVEADVSPVWDESGSVVSHIGTVRDVTGRRQLEAEWFEAAELFSTVFDVAPTPIVLTSVAVDGVEVLRSNAAYRALAGLAEGDEASADVYDETHPDDLDAARRGRTELIEGRIDLHRMELRKRFGDGPWRWCELTRSLVRSLDGTPRFMVARLEDIHDRRMAASEQGRLASTDPLTDLANRRSFDAALADLMPGGSRHGRTFGVVYVDLDHFKVVNDVLGHHVGDEVLREVAAVLTDAVRPDDLVARLGGDEFAVLLVDVTAESLEQIASRVATAIDVVRPLPDGRAHRVTASVGAARSTDVDLDHAVGASAVSWAQQLLRRADDAMYADKRVRRARGAVAADH